MIWRPNTTCECSVEYIINNELPPDPQHGGLSVSSFHFLEKCPAHSAFSDSQLWDIIWDENPRFGLSISDMLDNGPATLYDINPENGARTLKSNISLNITWSGAAPNRIMNVVLTGITLTTPQKNAIRTVLNNRFGGKVVLV